MTTCVWCESRLGSDGIRVSNTSHAAIRGGIVTQNMGNGIRVGGGTALPGQSTATIGVDTDAILEVTQNGGAGLSVVDDGFGSQVVIDSRNIVFQDNAEGDIVAPEGAVVDVAAEP